MRTLVSTLLVAGLLGNAGCRKKNEVSPDSCGLVNQRIAAVGKAAQDYALTPSTTNCTAYRAALNSYLDAATRCPTVTPSDITSARNAVKALTCP